MGDITVSANVQSFNSAADYAAMRTLIGLVIGTNVQAWDADLDTWAGLTPSANAQSLVTAANYATMRTLLGLVIGTNVQAFNSNLTTFAGIAPGTGVGTALAVNVGSAGAFITFNGAGGTPSSLTGTNITGIPLATGVSGLLAVGNGGTGVNNGSNNTITFSGNFPLTLGLSGSTTVTLPSSGTLSTLAGNEALTSKTINGLTISSSTGTLTISNGVVMTGPASSGTVVTLGNAETISGAKTFSGINLLPASVVRTVNAMGALAIDVTKGVNTKTISTGQTFTFSGTPATAATWFSVKITNSSGGAVTATIPSSFSVSQNSTITTVSVPAGGVVLLTWEYDGSVYNIYNDPPVGTGTGPFVQQTSGTLVTPLLGTPTSGTLTNCTGYTVANLSGGGTGVVSQLANAADGSNVSGIGFRGLPQNSQSTAYTTVMADAGKTIFHPSSDNNARTFTIDSNANVAYPIGTVIEFLNMAATSGTIAITTDTMTLLPAGTTGSRTLAQYGRASAEKISSTAWIISGNSALT